MIDYLLFLGEAAWSIYVFVVFAYEQDRDCKSENYSQYCVLVLCLMNAAIMVLKLIIHTICLIAYVVLLFTKQIKFERCGEAVGFLAFVLKKPDPAEYKEASKDEPLGEKDISKGPLKKSDKSYKEEED